MPVEKRGGRPRGPRPPGSTEPSVGVARDRIEAPELICEQSGPSFLIGFEADGGAATVLDQSGQPLTRRRDLQVVTSLVSPFLWRSVAAAPAPLELPPVLVFQLSSDGRRGRRTSRLREGRNLLVAPVAFELRQGEGQAIEARPGCGVAGFHAWTINIDPAEAAVVTLDGDGAAVEVPVGRVTATLAGALVGETDDGVPVFGSEPPRVVVPDELAGRLACIVVGGEDPAHRKIRARVGAGPELDGRIRSALPPDECGWYFARVYARDEQGAPVLEHSLSFWFAPGLRPVRVDGGTPLPANGHHEMLRVIVPHERSLSVVGCAAVQRDTGIGTPVEGRAVPGGTVVELPGDVVCDAVQVKITDTCATFCLRVPVDRYWWALADGDVAPHDWTCTRERARPEAFNADSRKHLWVRLPGWSPPQSLALQFHGAGQHRVRWKQGAQAAQYRLGDLEGDMRALKGAAADVYLVVTDDAGDEEDVAVLRMTPAYVCRVCHAFGSERRDSTERHIEANHWAELMTPVQNYEEIAEAYNAQHPKAMALPARIHKCPECTAFFPEDDWRAKRSKMEIHRRTCGNRRLRFEVITDLARIRTSSLAHVVAGLPDAFQCATCAAILFGEDEARRHLFDVHRGALYDAD